MKRTAIAALILSCLAPLVAQAWKPSDIGVGLVAFTGDDSTLNIVQRGKEWNPRELLASGALNARSDGTGKFAVWIAGKRDKAFLDKDGMVAWNWSYRITWPDGKTSDFGVYGLKAGAFDASMINFGSFSSGKFKVEFWVHNRASGKKYPVGKVDFTAVDKEPPAPVLKTPIPVKDMGAGLVILDAEYDTKLKIQDRGNGTWNIKSLLDTGALNGSTDGKPHFCAWLVVPPVSSFQDEYGSPKWMYSYRLTYPDGKTWDSSPSYFRTPGFASFELGIGGYTAGSWKVDFFILDKATRAQSYPAGTVEFMTIYE